MNMEALKTAWRESSAKCADLNTKVSAALTDGAFDKDSFKKLKDELDQEKVRRNGLNDQIKSLEKEQGNQSKDTVKDEKGGLDLSKKPSDKIKQSILDYMQRKPAVNQVSSTEMSPTIPEEIIYDPTSEVNSVVDLATLIMKRPVNTPSGTYPIKQRATDYLPTTEELKANPELAAPNFEDVNWKAETHRGALTISQESIDDGVATLEIVGQDIGEKRVNTHNHEISPILKSFTAKSIQIDSDNSVDGIKEILNVDLDPAYAPSIVASQTFFNKLDTLKDKQGQYVFHRDITSSSKGILLGVPVYRVGDDLLGEKGEAHAFIGDLSKAVFMADRKEVNLSWEYDQVYGQYLAAVLRFGVTKADENAGYFVTIAPKA